jgi:nuclease S1
MARRNPVWLVAICAVLAALEPRTALAFGPLAHRIAGLLAEPELCAAARVEVTSLGRESLADAGIWADRIRSEPEWRQSAPWHYMNVNDPPAYDSAATLAAIRAFRHPPEGDVLYAIDRFRTDLANRALPRRVRADALRFLVHFIVDVHQPLHVGRAADRGGNEIDVRYGSETVNLHRFWDTDVLALRGFSAERYASRLRPAFAAVPASRSRDGTEVWAAESLALRATVYGFGRQREAGTVRVPVVLEDEYVVAAQAAAEQRLVVASARLAATLNALWCPGEVN